MPSFVMLLLTLFLCSCAPVTQRPPEGVSSLALSDISEGLPRDGFWRQNIALADMNGDGLLDIVAPPPRGAKEGEKSPVIFLRDGKGWKKGAFDFPPLKGYGYGGIAVGDLNGDGKPDIVLAVHGGEIVLLENNGSNGFVQRPFSAKKDFNSRTVAISDVNTDGRPDIIALSEAPFSAAMLGRPRGILVGINKGEGGWDVRIVEGSEVQFGDSMAIGDIKGEGNKAIAIAPLVDQKEARPVWFGDGKGGFTAHDANLTPDVSAFLVAAGDVSGDGKDEVVFNVSGFGQEGKISLSVFTWTGAGFADISKGLETIDRPLAFDLADLGGDRKKELVVLSMKGIGIYNFTDKGWTERGFYPLPAAETIGAFDLKTGKNRDGSLVIVYNLGRAEQSVNNGLRAYLLK